MGRLQSVYLELLEYTTKLLDTPTLLAAIRIKFAEAFLIHTFYTLSLHAGVDEDVVNVVEGVADAVENQADADRDATLSDRLKMAGMKNNTVITLAWLRKLEVTI